MWRITWWAISGWPKVLRSRAQATASSRQACAAPQAEAASVKSLGVAGWIDSQFAKPATGYPASRYNKVQLAETADCGALPSLDPAARSLQAANEGLIAVRHPDVISWTPSGTTTSATLGTTRFGLHRVARDAHGLVLLGSSVDDTGARQIQLARAPLGVALRDDEGRTDVVDAPLVLEVVLPDPLDVAASCQNCHPQSAEQLMARVQRIQDTTQELLRRGETAVAALIADIAAARSAGATDEALKEARAFQRRAQFMLDFVSAENSSGFHAPQEAARILAASVDLARQGQLALGRAGGARPPA